MPVSTKQARAFLEAKERQRQEGLDRRFERAWTDFRRIVDRILADYRPLRLYQWGSLLDRSRFSERSDIDLAVEGVTDPATFSAMFGMADRLTDLPLDLVALERIEPEFAGLIRRKGVLVYERGTTDRPAAG
ncbi:MAG: nucleotidyltransferase domain-containing protein [Verrucomicrobiae bacterium]|nr:nucleotidyltransferase domain-containing protein [Verrucomicrobiae bacterium]